MADKKKYIITRSNYTVKKKHKTLNDDRIIYERDFMVTSSSDTWGSNGGPYSTGTFKMVSNTKSSGHYRYNTGDWLKQHCYGNDPEVWTYNCVDNKEDISNENNIVIIPNYNSLLDFAYYKSCKELLRTSTENIISNFPAELYFSKTKLRLDDDRELFLIENPFNIDLVNKVPENNEENILRTFSASFNDYEIIHNNKGKNVTSWEVINEGIKESCAKEGDLLYTIFIENKEKTLVIEGYYLNGEVTFLYEDEENNDIRIRPLKKHIDKFFNELDDFQKVMLNRETNPVYTMTLDYPRETERGIETSKEKFTWPISNKWNLIINSGEYSSYMKKLLTLAEYYDNRRTNNLWRVMTHDSLKNPGVNVNNNKIENDEKINGSEIFETIIKCFAKQFDDIKYYIDNIKKTNTITYDNSSNIPSYFLSDKLEMNGWEVYNLSKALDSSKTVNGSKLLNNTNKEYHVSDVNVGLMKHLQINSKNILSRKGTKHGIEMLLGLFGLTSYDHNKTDYDYKITEYVDTIIGNDRISIDDVEKYNSQKITYWNTTYGITKEKDPLAGLPLKKIITKGYGDYDVIYAIPWLDKTQIVDGDIYFQMFGGWCKTFKKDVDVKKGYEDDVISVNNNPIYDETIKHLLIVDKLNDLSYVRSDKLYNGCVVYVHNIDNFDDVYKNDKLINITLTGENDSLKASNYFILEDTKHSYLIGSMEDGDKVTYGWENITIDEIENPSKYKETNRGIKVRLLESVIEDHKGNNPHGGYGKYDDGEGFVNYFRQIFKYSIENDNFNDNLYTCENGELKEEVKKVGFDIEKQKDNVKTWYFTDTIAKSAIDPNSIGGLKEIVPIYDDVYEDVEFNGKTYKNIKFKNATYTINDMSDVKVGNENKDTFFESELTPFDFENLGEQHDESTANSIINDKKLLIEFSGPIVRYYDDFPIFLQEAIMPYLKQILPSTTIVEIRIEGGYAGYTDLPFALSNIEEEKMNNN